MSTSSFPKLEQFLGSYFHQDWPLEAETTSEIIEAYRRKASPRSLSDLTQELAELRAEKLNETQLRKRMEALGACLDPSAEGLSYSQWLANLESTLQSPTSKPKKTPPRR
ncbi:MAG: hypothetical protein JNN07_23525 [Verrucomicrobiales bacterium]|nr:hypothetical protein [Verrucomicrobiales bacterium]